MYMCIIMAGRVNSLKPGDVFKYELSIELGNQLSPVKHQYLYQ